MKSLTRAFPPIPYFGILGLMFLVAAAWVAFGLAMGLASVGAALLLIDYRAGDAS